MDAEKALEAHFGRPPMAPPDRIDVTAAMIDAGVATLQNHVYGTPLSVVAAAVYRAMVQAQEKRQ